MKPLHVSLKAGGTRRSRDAIRQAQQRGFQRVLRYAWQHSAFYREYYASHGIRAKDLAEVTVRDLPFTTRSMLMEHFDTVTTDPRLRRRDIEQWLAQHPNPRELFHEAFIIVTSSGSSGRATLFAYDRAAWQYMNAMMADRLPAPENALSGKTRVAFYLITGGHFGGVISSAHMPASVYDTLTIPLTAPEQQVIETLHRFQPHRLSGYASCIAMLAEWALAGRLRIQPNTIAVSSDLLTQDMTRKIRAAWQAPLYNLYTASESLYIAMQQPGTEQMQVMDDLNLLEILDDSHHPVSPGETGRVVLTNLYNYSLPILRYALGDYARRGTSLCDAPFSTIRSLQGRANDALPVVVRDSQHDTLHPSLLEIFHVAGLEKVQFISWRPDHVEITYVAPRSLDEAVRQAFQSLLDHKGAVHTTCEVRRVPHIPNDPRTGKYRLVVCKETSAPPASGGISPQPRRHRVEPTTAFRPFPRQAIAQLIPQRFEQQVENAPHHLAVKDGEHAWTYQALHRAANRLAHALRAAGVSADAPIALLLGHDAHIILGLLGVLKAGHFYLPLDPGYPQDYLTSLMRDAQVRQIVTDLQHIARAQSAAPPGTAILCLDNLDAEFDDETPAMPLTPDAPAYVLYSSGSTGVPKGVVQTHRHVLHNIYNYTNALHMNAHDRAAWLFAPGFSAAATNLFGVLLNGATLCPFDIRQRGIAPLAAWLRREQITTYHSVPTVFRHLMRTVANQEGFPHIRLVELAGEPVYARDVAQYRRHFTRDCLLLNRLGSTETGSLCVYFMNHDTPVVGEQIPVGYAVEDHELSLVDHQGRPVAAGQAGEVVVRSRYLSPGYWRQPELTRTRFQSEPGNPTYRRYATGDMGRQLPDGCLIYMGRRDAQVKIRGQAVELTAVEAALLEMDDIQEAAVVGSDPAEAAPDRRLVAYLVLKAHAVLAVGDLRRALARQLPAFMIPSAFMCMRSLPLTATGKVDRRALRALRPERPGQEAVLTAPRTPVETTLTAIWQEVLGIEQIGIHDNFFDLGGHSLTAAQVLARIQDTFQSDLPLRVLFESPTVSDLAILITSEQVQQRQTNTMRQPLPHGEDGTVEPT